MRGLKDLDRILRGEATAAPELRQHGFNVPLGPLLAANVALAAFAGLCMGVFALFGRPDPEIRQMAANVVKVPLLFLLTLLVTFPSLYVFNALIGSRLGVRDLARLMAAAMGVLLAVLAAFGPIVAFFSVTTASYPFVVLLNVAVFAIAGGFGVVFLLRTLEKLTPAPRLPPPDPPADVSASPEGTFPGAPPPRAPPDTGVRVVFRVWLIVFAVVGAQMSWVMRPFIGSPNAEFTWFRPRESSFFDAVFQHLRMLFGN